MTDPRVAAGFARLIETRRSALDSGTGSLGWKAAFGAPSSRQLLDLHAPAVGYLTEATRIVSGAAVDITDWVAPLIEFELALTVGRVVDPGEPPDDARKAISAVGPAIELADVDLPVDQAHLEDIVAGNIFHRHVVFGRTDPDGAGCDLEGLQFTATVGDTVHNVTDFEEMTGDYGEVVVTVAQYLAGHGLELGPGDVVIGGSVVPPIRVAGPVVAHYRLGDAPSITVELVSGPS
ncbi:MAG: fumarylacetoacetate hydrolase family protein [Acidimicrobiia bacterium]|nr:fumarylacetoacetate hydrolase family protein [Acidimicrobiia bacterium]